MNHPTPFWTTWITLVVVGGVYLGYCLTGQKEEIALPGTTTHGHYQIEMNCQVCHTKGEGVRQDACVQCHGEELKRMNDSHPVVKFKDPRNADRLKHIDAVSCVACHREHQPELTGTMGLSLPSDYCYFCHQTIAEERPTHQGLGFDTCATAGCHNFHDNTALYEKFLVDHLDEPALKENPSLPERRRLVEKGESLKKPITIQGADMPDSSPVSREILQDWQNTAHAQAAVNCTDCHETRVEPSGPLTWVDTPDHKACQTCHEHESKGFLESRHGMRLALDLSPMTPAMARLPMHKESAHKTLSCTSCHSSHRFTTRHAAVEACVQCHNDEHTRNYFNSPHYATWLEELRGIGKQNTGVSCATCHLPRISITESGEDHITVDHNQNNTLRPNEKMIRSACIHCHGLQFSINSLADEVLIENNFQGQPNVFIDSLEMARKEKLRASE